MSVLFWGSISYGEITGRTSLFCSGGSISYGELTGRTSLFCSGGQLVMVR